MQKLHPGEYLGIIKKSFYCEGLIVSEAEYGQKVFEGWHSHENNHISFIYRGGNREQRRSRELQVKPGNIIFYNSGQLHRNLDTALPSKNINVEIEEGFLKEYNIKLESFDYKNLQYTDAKFALLKIYSECKINDRLTPTSAHALLLCMLNGSLSEKTEDTSPKWINLITDILNDCWNENLSLDELSKSLNIHPVTISKYFPKYFNCTLGEYIRKIRVEKALAALSIGKNSLTEVAYECGFFDQSHFIRTFKDYTGFSPKAYRNI